VSISQDENKINGEPVGTGGLLLVNTLLKTPEDFIKSYTIPEKEYFFAGRTNNSFDSRYWGTIQHDQILGRAYAIF